MCGVVFRAILLKTAGGVQEHLLASSRSVGYHAGSGKGTCVGVMSSTGRLNGVEGWTGVELQCRRRRW
jgi:hypothetical protein